MFAKVLQRFSVNAYCWNIRFSNFVKILIDYTPELIQFRWCSQNLINIFIALHNNLIKNHLKLQILSWRTKCVISTEDKNSGEKLGNNVDGTDFVFVLKQKS